VTTDSTTAPDPLLHWTAIAEHARDHHGANWATSERAMHAIIGAFDSILPDGADYDHRDGAIRPADDDDEDEGTEAAALPRWGDTQLLSCMIAALATSPPACDLEAIYGTETFVAPRYQQPPPGERPARDQPPG
jgi:hypothetical protein